MSLNLRWVGEADYDRVAEARMLCYAPTPAELDQYKDDIRTEPRGKPGGFLLAEENGELAGTATVYDFTTWVRGSPLPCQGVAYVGTVRTKRRGKPGIGSTIMWETLAEARRRGQVMSSLMPFRASYYEHFGYGVVERRCEWTVPLSVLPQGDFDGIRYAKPSDRAAIAACHQRSVERGQCDMERNDARWRHIHETFTEGFQIVDADGRDARGYLFYTQQQKEEKDYLLIVTRHAADDAEAFRRQLHFLASLKDQYYAVRITVPAGFALNWFLNERQLPHRFVNHAYAEMRPFTRMQVKILDHGRLLRAMHLPAEARGEAIVAVRETEGHVSKFRLRIEGGRADVAPTDASPDVEMTDVTWAAVALGEIRADAAEQWGLLDVSDPEAVRTLTALSVGPVPFCEEYF